MAKRKKDSGTSVNLFPFLSILVCIIGCLTLIIVVLNLMSMSKAEGREPKEVERAREYVEMKKKQDEDQKKYDDLRQLIENLIQQNKDTLTQMQKLELLKNMLENQEEIDASREELIAKFNLLQNTNKKLDEDHNQMVVQIEEMKKEIAKRKLPPDPSRMRVIPSGSGTNIEPYFVEIADKTVLIHQSLTEPPVEIPSASVNQDENFVKLLDAIAAKPYRRLIFLVRGNPEAVANLGRANAVVGAYNQTRGSEIIAGRLPLPGDGKVDLSMFAQYLKP
ncbi:MAG: hypothetical protein KDM91_01275 [Verrucomicrobiae bacterium]|nr:hypothetical protein [Verrucomicrobiae bacterium]MCP5542051.1 hypothetical protein [Akkermansiaceae bacterium]MCP5551029.1 hypothetical protein [Akkermansiaceae bacterium]